MLADVDEWTYLAPPHRWSRRRHSCFLVSFPAWRRRAWWKNSRSKVRFRFSSRSRMILSSPFIFNEETALLWFSGFILSVFFFSKFRIHSFDWVICSFKITHQKFRTRRNLWIGIRTYAWGHRRASSFRLASPLISPSPGAALRHRRDARSGRSPVIHHWQVAKVFLFGKETGKGFVFLTKQGVN